MHNVADFGPEDAGERNASGFEHAAYVCRSKGGQMTPLLEARGIVKRFGHVTALGGADFAVNAGEVTALIGDNGAGKSTLVKVLSACTRPTRASWCSRASASGSTRPSTPVSSRS